VNVETIDAASVHAGGATPHANINLICCDIASHFAVRSRLGEEFFQGRYNIGVWLWECPDFPKRWYDRFAYYDEIWAPTSFIASALAPIAPVPVIRMPFAIERQAPASRAAGRRRLNLQNDEFLYLFIFNFYSRWQRKNPMAVIEAFKQAFKPEESARLVIKCANAAFSFDHFRELQQQAEGHRVTIVDGQWSEGDMADLVAACDCYVSLHRAEGVGLTIGEAMAAGKPVVATGWSGNMDLMDVSNSYPVRYTLSELSRNVAHYRAGDVWAEPSIEHAAEMLRRVFERRDEASVRAKAGQRDIQRLYSTETIGAAIRERLAVIAQRRRFRALQQTLGSAGAEDRFHDAFSDLGAYGPQEHTRYERLKKELREIVRSRVPGGATVLVVSRGDDDFLKVDPCHGRHFPAAADDRYAGYHPKDSAEAIERLEEVRAEGGDFLVFPNTAFWWLDHYGEFRDHLLARYRMAHHDERCVMFELRTHS
jgi:glycosyltransferase involved in cell wall biosynthesis